MKKTSDLINAINDLGNALTLIGWPGEYADNDLKVKVRDTKAIYKDLMASYFEMTNMESDLYDCVNELCLKCGQYKQSHLGACDDCRWKKVKEELK